METHSQEKQRAAMKTYLECIPCFMNQIIRTGRLLNITEGDIYDLMAEFGAGLSDIEMHDPPPKTAISIYSAIAKRAGTDDPFRELKKESMLKALGLLPSLASRLERLPSPLSMALRIACAANVIDFGISTHFDLDKELERALSGNFGLWEEDVFLDALKKTDWVLYLGDNAGEAAFDRLLIRAMHKEVVFATRGRPIINDVTMDDALMAGIDEDARLVSSGSPAPGVILDMCDPAFVKLFETAPLIVSKGQGNYETLSETKRPIFFLLKAKCQVVARHLAVREGEMILARGKGFEHRH